MAFDAHSNFGYSTIAVAPAPAASGLTLTVAAGEGARFPAAPFNCTVWPAGATPTSLNAEIIRVTSKGGGDDWTIVRTAETGAPARTILVGDQIANTVTVKIITDLETSIPSTAGLLSAINVSAGTTSNNLSAVTFSNSNGVSFGLNGSVLTGTVATNYQAPGAYLTTAMRSDAVTLSNINVSAGTTSQNLSAIVFSNSNALSFGLSGSTITGSYTVPAAQTTQSAIKGFGASNTGNTAGNTGLSTGIDWVLAGSNNITVSESTAAGGPNTLWVSGPTLGGAQTGISGIQVSDTTYTSGTVTFRNANGISFGSSGAQGISASYTVPTQSVQTLGIYGSNNTTGQSSSSTYDARSLSLVGDGIISVGWSNSSLRISATVAAQTNQTLGIYASSNTTLTSSGTLDARSLSFRGIGIASIGYSAGEVLISVPAGGGGITNINVSAGTTSNNLSNVTFADSNGVSFGLNASTITATVSTYSTVGTATTVKAVASANSVGTITRWAAEDHAHVGVGAVGISTAGNTAGTTGSEQGTYWFQGGNNIVVSQITSNNGSHTLVLSGSNAFVGLNTAQTNVTWTVNSSGISFNAGGYAGTVSGATNASVTVNTAGVSVNVPFVTASYFANFGLSANTTAITQTSGSSIWVQPFFLPYALSVGFIRILASLNDSAVGTAGTTNANATFSCERYTTIAAVVYSQGVGASSRSLQSVTSSSDGLTGRTQYQAGAQGSQYTITIQKSYPVSGTSSSYTTSYAVSSASIVISSNSNTLFTGLQWLDLRWGNSLKEGNYWLGIGASTSSASQSSNLSFCGTAALPMSLAGMSQTNISFGVLGGATSASDHQLLLGAGLWTTNASGISTGSLGLNSVSQVVSNPLLPFQFIRWA